VSSPNPRVTGALDLWFHSFFFFFFFLFSVDVRDQSFFFCCCCIIALASCFMLLLHSLGFVRFFPSFFRWMEDLFLLYHARSLPAQSLLFISLGTGALLPFLITQQIKNKTQCITTQHRRNATTQQQPQHPTLSTERGNTRQIKGGGVDSGAGQPSERAGRAVQGGGRTATAGHRCQGGHGVPPARVCVLTLPFSLLHSEEIFVLCASFLTFFSFSFLFPFLLNGGT
jgi:hypothetical protein